MGKMLVKNLNDLSNEDLQKFLDGIDTIILDVDGVVWNVYNEPIDGITETFKKLRQLNKNIYFATNCCLLGFLELYRRLAKLNPDLPIANVITPTSIILSYLKQINFNKEILIWGTAQMKNDFRDAGFVVADSGPHKVAGDNIGAIHETLKQVNEIGAVILDVDFSVNFIKMCKFINCISNEQVLYMSCSSQKNVKWTEKLYFPAQGDFEALFHRITGRKFVCFGKPDHEYEKYLKSQLPNVNPSKTLFIGDTLNADITLGHKCGFQTLLVLTGISELKDLENCPKEWIPNFYLDSLGNLHKILETKLNL